jgi:hypothetical protein
MVTTSFIPPLFPYTLYFPRCRVDRAALKALKRKKEKGEREREREREKKERGTRDAVSLACFAPVWRRVNRIFREEVRRARITLSLSLSLSSPLMCPFPSPSSSARKYFHSPREDPAGAIKRSREINRRGINRACEKPLEYL